MRPVRKLLVVFGIIVGLVSAAGLLLIYTPLGMLTIVFHQNPGPFHRQTMEAIVAQVRTSGLQPDKEEEFVVGSLSDPTSLRPWKQTPASSMAKAGNRVWAEISADGKLKVVIETRDLGHAGTYGFAYSDSPLSPKPFGPEGNWLLLDVPGDLNMVQPNMKIDDHWWKVLNNLN